MADPLSITASIIAVIQITSKVVSLCYDYRAGLKNAPKEMKQLIDEIVSFRDILEYVLKLVEAEDEASTQLSTLKLFTKADGILLTCKSEMTELENDLKPATGIRGVARSLKWPYAKAETEKRVERLGWLKSSLTLALATDHISLALETQKETKQIKLHIQTLGRDLESHYNREEYRRIKTLLDAPDPSSNYLAAKSQRDPGSGHWLVEDKRYYTWKNASPSLLWLHGIPGCGKTLLCSRIIDDLTTLYSEKESVALAYFFFDFSTPTKQTYENLLRSLIMQLSVQSSSAWQILFNSTKSSCDSRETTWTVSDNFLLHMLDRYLLVYNKIYLVLDALDESTDQDHTLQFAVNLLGKQSARVSVLITSRQERNIEQALENAATEVVAITAEATDYDIRLHIQKKLGEDKRFQKWPEALRSDIEASLTKGALGMFKWVDCQLERLQKCLKPSGVKAILASLPKTLGETYKNIIAGIDEEYRTDALTIFQWLIYSRRTLRVDEIAEVLAIEYAREPEFSPEFRLQDARDILSVCSSTITIDNSGAGSRAAEVRLAHASVRDFLLAGGADFDAAPKSVFEARVVHEKLAQSCLAYLLYLGSPHLDEDSISTKFPFVDYAARNWMIHAKEAEGSDNIRKAALKLLRRDKLCFKRLLQFYDVDRPWQTIENEYVFSRSFLRRARVHAPSLVSSLYYASLAGLPSVVRSLLQHGEDVNERCGFFGDALSAAASQGHEDVVKILLRDGADPKSHCGFQQGPLMAAATAGHESIVETLLESGASITNHFRHGNALVVAIQNGHEGIVRLLITKGANLNDSFGKISWSPLQEAVIHGQGAIVKMLLEAGARCDERILQLAARTSNEPVLEIVRTHLTRPYKFNRTQSVGATVSAWTSRQMLVLKTTLKKGSKELAAQQTPAFFASAAAGGLDKLVQELLDSGIDVNSYEEYQAPTALSCAAGNGHDSTVKLLLHKGADINLQPTYYMPTPIDAAARNGHLAVVRTLLRAEPPSSLAVSATAYGNPLESAALSGDLAVLQEILNYDPDVNAISTYGEGDNTALAAAATIGHEAMVRLLLSRGAEVNLVPPGYNGYSDQMSPLACAVYWGRIEVAQLLLASGADINLISGSNPQSPLRLAASKGQTSMVELMLDSDSSQAIDQSTFEAAIATDAENIVILRLLLDRHVERSTSAAETQFPSTSKSSLAQDLILPLLLAARHGHPSILKELLDRGAYVNGQDNRGYTALHEAAQHGQDSVAKILFEDHNADLHSRLQNGSLPIHVAAQYGSDGCIKNFLGQNVDVDVVNDERLTPLHIAIDYGRIDTVRFLLASGARLDLVDQYQMTSLDLAEYRVVEEQNNPPPFQPTLREKILEIIIEELKNRTLDSSGLPSARYGEQLEE